MAKKKPNFSGVEDVVVLLRQQYQVRDEIRRYFYADSKLWKALREALSSPGNGLLIAPKGCKTIRWSRGHGPNVSLHGEPYLYVDWAQKPPVESVVYVVMVTWNRDGNDDFYDSESDNGTTTEHRFGLPAALETDFQQTAFDAWLVQRRKACQEEHRKTATDILAQLVERFGSQAVEAAITTVKRSKKGQTDGARHKR